MNSTVLILFAGFVAYCVLGGMLLRVWQRRTLRPANLRAYGGAWLAYELPRLIRAEVFALLGVGLWAMALFAVAPWLRSAAGTTVRLTLVFAVPGCAVMLVAVDVVLVVLVRRRQRATAQAHPDDAP